METIDINKVAGLQALDSEGNVLGVVSMEQLTDMVAGKLATELAAQNTAPAMRTMSLTASPAAASVAATGVDKTEGQLGDVTDPGYVRVLDKSGNSGKQGIEQFAQVVGELLKTSRWDLIYSEVKDGDGAGIMNVPVTGLIIAVDITDISKYIVYIFVKDKAGDGDANRIVLSNNELSLGATNEQGTSVINGSTNVKQFMLGLGID